MTNVHNGLPMRNSNASIKPSMDVSLVNLLLLLIYLSIYYIAV
jgi:hypothetical protein